MYDRTQLHRPLSRRLLLKTTAVGAGAAVSATLLPTTGSTMAAPRRQTAGGELKVGVTQTTFRTDPDPGDDRPVPPQSEHLRQAREPDARLPG